FTMPITLHVQDLIPTELPYHQLTSQPDGVQIQLTVPTSPRAEGAIVERQDQRDLVWHVLSDPLTPDAMGRISFFDRTATPDSDYEYRFRVRYVTGQVVVYGPYPHGYHPPAPTRLEVSLASPNPSRDAFLFRVGIPSSARLDLGVFDVRGRRLQHLVDGSLRPGVHLIPWDGRSDDGNRVGAGIYWIRARSAGQTVTLRVVRLR
ncbi:MAG: T9SS type A sorting domain-containing protein, partial [Candidatus Eisenbacteria bacterium]|nr:T9SS type A sorting domain-containing protein [Candidatus Eisenbacteria bacterium]